MRKPMPVSWFAIAGLAIAAGGTFAMGLAHVYEPGRFCLASRHQGVCVEMLVWFGLGSLLAMLTMAKVFEDAMRFLDSQDK